MINLNMISTKTRLTLAVCIPLFLLGMIVITFIIYNLTNSIINEEKKIYNKLIASYKENIESLFIEAMEDGQCLAEQIQVWYQNTDINQWDKRFSEKYYVDKNNAVRTKYADGDTYAVFVSNIGDFNDRVKRMILATDGRVAIHQKVASLKFLDTYIVMPEQFILIDNITLPSLIPANFDFLKQEWANMVIPANNPARKSVWSSVYYDPFLEYWMISNASPIYNGNDYLGSVGHDISIQDLFKRISENQQGINGSKHLIIDSKGHLIYHPDYINLTKGSIKQTLQKYTYEDRHDKELLEAIKQHSDKLSSQKAVSTNTVINNERYIVTFSYLKAVDWYYVQLIPYNIVLSEIHSLVINTISSFIIIVLLISALIYFINKQVVIKPIEEIVSYIKRIALGDIPAPLGKDYKGEFNDIKTSLNALIKNYSETVQMAERIANGDLEVHASLRSSKDILAKSLNKMSNNLKIMMSNLNKAKSKAETANRAKSVFLANMSHELRTPLTSILGYSEMLQKNLSIASKQRENLNIINRSGEHLLMIINEVLEIAKIESGHVAVKNSAFDLQEFLQSIRNMFQIKTDAKKLRLNLYGIEDLPRYIEADIGKLRKVLINLLGNAVKFTQQGEISIHVGESKEMPEKQDKFLFIEIHDTGVGIEKHEQDKVFDYFEQTKSGRDSKTGTGLGLAISRDYIRIMGGRITMTSTPGQKTVFRVEIPLKESSAQLAEKDYESQQVSRLIDISSPPRVLIAEDTEGSRLLLKKILVNVGFNVKVAENGRKALEIYNDWKPHFIWLDIRMPVIDGMEVIRQIKDVSKDHVTKVAALTAHAFEDEKESILTAGFDAFVRKPYHASEIFEEMKKHLNIDYVYEEKGIQEQAYPDSTVVSSDALEAIPDTILQQLHQAVLELDTGTTLELIDQVGKYDQAIGNKFKMLAQKLDYSYLLKILEMEREEDHGTDNET